MKFVNINKLTVILGLTFFTSVIFADQCPDPEDVLKDKSSCLSPDCYKLTEPGKILGMGGWSASNFGYNLQILKGKFDESYKLKLIAVNVYLPTEDSNYPTASCLYKLNKEFWINENNHSDIYEITKDYGRLSVIKPVKGTWKEKIHYTTEHSNVDAVVGGIFDIFNGRKIRSGDYTYQDGIAGYHCTSDLPSDCTWNASVFNNF